MTQKLEALKTSLKSLMLSNEVVELLKNRKRNIKGYVAYGHRRCIMLKVGGGGPGGTPHAVGR